MLIEEASRFTQLIAGTDELFLRTFHDRERNKTLYPGHNYQGTWAQNQPYLASDQTMGYGVYMVINAGGHTDSAIQYHRASFIDIDVYKGDPVPLNWHVPPHIICERRNSDNVLQAMHAYWLTEPGADMPAWMTVQKQLAQYYRSDGTVFNPSRVMRIPGTYHQKDEPAIYRITWQADDLTRLPLSVVATGLPAMTADSVLPTKRGEVVLETDDPHTQMRVKSYLMNCEPAIEGEHGDQHTFAVAARCREEGLSVEVTLALMWEIWNPRCEPVWDYGELETKVYNAYNYSQKPQGSANAQAMFDRAGGGIREAEMPPPSDEPVIPAGGGNYDKNHSINAAQFLISHYPGKQLMRVQREFYRYTGKVWELINDAYIKHQLAVGMLGSNPSDGIVNGTFGMLCNLCYSAIPLGSWPGHNADNMSVYNNGILDMFTRELHPHTADYFTTALLPYDYNPAATAPRWTHFINAIFDRDKQLIDLLQEWLGYQLTTSNAFQKAMLLLGQRRSGKGTIGRVLEHLVGTENYSGMTLGGLANDAVLESVLTTRVLFIGDAHNVGGLNQSLVLDRFLSITGGDQIPVPRKYIGAWRGRLPGRITMAANAAPRFIDDSGAMSSRFLILPFANSWLGRENLNLDAELHAEIEGINSWALEGLRRLYQQGGFTQAQASLEEQRELAVSYSPLNMFVEEYCIIQPDQKVFTEQLYFAYRAWSMSVGSKPQSRNGFVGSMRSAFRGDIAKKPITIGERRAQGFTGIGLAQAGVNGSNVIMMPQVAQ